MIKVKIRSVYHKGQDSFVGKAITGWTWFLALWYNWKVLKHNYSHEEQWSPDEQGRFMVDGKPVGMCRSSTTRGDAKGVRIAPASEVLKHLERWDYIEAEVCADRLEVASEEFKKLVGKLYDFLGIFGYLQPFVIQDKTKWYCSEICNWFKTLCGLCKRDRRISPRRSACEMAKTWGEPKSLVG